MKKLYKKGKVHPTPPLNSDRLLPATILTLAAALSPQDREVLAYLISCAGGSPGNIFKPKKTTHNKTSGGGGGVTAVEHSPMFNCNCFLCYTSYWVRWDASPNRQLIHDIIDAYEDELATKKIKNNKKDRKKKGCSGSGDLKRLDEDSVVSSRVDSGELEREEVGSVCDGDGVCEDSREMDGDEEEDEEFEKGSVRKFVSFIGERIWGVWG